MCAVCATGDGAARGGLGGRRSVGCWSGSRFGLGACGRRPIDARLLRGFKLLARVTGDWQGRIRSGSVHVAVLRPRSGAYGADADCDHGHAHTSNDDVGPSLAPQSVGPALLNLTPVSADSTVGTAGSFSDPGRRD